MNRQKECRLSTANTQTAKDKPNISHAAITSSTTSYHNCGELSTVPRMRTIKQTAELAGVAEYFVRRLCKSGEFKGFVKAGCKTLINFDLFVAFLNGESGVGE